jgi:hypothetical protein
MTDRPLTSATVRCGAVTALVALPLASTGAWVKIGPELVNFPKQAVDRTPLFDAWKVSDLSDCDLRWMRDSQRRTRETSAHSEEQHFQQLFFR